MASKAENEQVFIMNAPRQPPPYRSTLTVDTQIQSIRKGLLVILGVLLALSVIALISAVFEYQPEPEQGNTRRGTRTSGAFISIFFYGLGFFAAYRCSALSLRIFGYLSIAVSGATGIALGLKLIFAIMTLAAPESVINHQNKYSIFFARTMTILSVIILAAHLFVSIVTALLTFLLARLIDAKN